MLLSVTIAAKNEERNIRNCLESVKWADEIVVVDDASTDDTVKVAREYTDRVYVNDSKGDFHLNKNLAIERASGDWILSLDADEVISPELAEEIKEAVKDEKRIGYYVNRKNYFLGKWIKRCGWYPNRILRLFRKGAAQWPLAYNVHDTPRIDEEDKTGYLEGDLLHLSYQSWEQYWKKFELYTDLLAEQAYKKGKRIGVLNSIIHFILHPVFIFLKKYILLRGFIDGYFGFFISIGSARTIIISNLKLLRKQKQGNV